MVTIYIPKRILDLLEAQADLDIFKKNSGFASLINSLKGHKMFGTIELEKPERSAVAQMCDLIH